MKPEQSRRFSRRSALKLACAALPASLTAAAPVRIGIIGTGSRGTGLLRVLLGFPQAEVAAICDPDGAAAERAQAMAAKARGHKPALYQNGPDDYRRMLERKDLAAVLIATPQEIHARISLDAMAAGKFAACEVPACLTLEDCHKLVEAERRTKAGYMLLENYRYSRAVMQISSMVQSGAFGDLTYAECAYIHEIRAMRFGPQGQLTWRGRNVADYIGDLYPTHSVGPVCGWLGVNREDRLVSMVTMASKAAATHEYAVKRFGAGSPQAQIEFRNGDTNNTLIRTKLGRLIAIRYDVASPRPPGMGQYGLQGTRGAYQGAFGEHKVFLEGRSKAHEWEPLDKYRAEFDHPYWKERGEEAAKTGHSGGDYFVIADMLEAIATRRSPIPAIDAATWSAIRPLSAESLRRGSAPVDIPDFTKA